jgi:hypothetical protein
VRNVAVCASFFFEEGFTVKSETKKHLVWLKEMAGKCGELLYERISRAASIFDDKDWVVAPNGGGGSDDTAAERLDSYFPELLGSFSFLELRAIYNEFPEKPQWQEQSYNLKTMYALYLSRSKQEKVPRARRSVTVAEYDDLEKKYEDAEFALHQMRKEYDTRVDRASYQELEKRYADLREKYNTLLADYEELRSENAVLRGRIDQMEKIFSVQKVAAGVE